MRIGGNVQNPNYLPLIAGRYYFTPNATSTSTSSTLGNGTLRLTPHYIPNATALTKIGAEVTSASASTLFRLGIYADDGEGRPGRLIVDAGTIDGGSATVQEKDIAVTIGPGWYWFGGAVQNAAGTQPTMRTSSSFGPSVDNGSSTPSTGASAIARAQASVTGALPATFTDTGAAAGGATPRIFIKT